MYIVLLQYGLMIQLDRHQPASVQTVTYKSFKFASLSLFCCCVCERIVTTTKMAALKGSSLLTAVSTAVSCVSVGSSILIAWGYSYNRSQQDALFLNFILTYNSTCFGQTYCLSSGVSIMYSQQQQTVNINSMTNTTCCEYSI